jgi:hypothetical protein
MATTTNFGWTTPDDTDLVKDGAAAIRTLGSAIDTSLVDLKGGTTGQILSKTSNTDMDFTWIANDQGDITEVQAGTGISVASGTGPIPVVTNTVATTFDAAGDVLVGTGSDTWKRLAIGTAGQVLTVNSGATDLEWAAAGGATSFVGVSLWKSSSQSISNDTNTAVTFDNEFYDTDGFHSTSTNTSRITIPAGKGGYYLVWGYVSYDANGTGSRSANININGSTRISQARIQAVTESGSNTCLNTMIVQNLSAGDYVELIAYQKSGGSLNVQGDASPDTFRTKFGAYFIGA